jgi:hypothetical protein
MLGGRRTLVRCPDCAKQGKKNTLFTNFGAKGDTRELWCEICGYRRKESVAKLKGKGLEYPVIQRGGTDA